MGKDSQAAGHLLAVFTIFVWGVTFVSTKVLLRDFQPVEILLLRFVMGFIVLYLVSPGRLKVLNLHDHFLLMGAGFTGICLYYLLENIALCYTMASNVSVILAATPMFTALVVSAFNRSWRLLTPSFLAGFAAAMTGICLISFNGVQLQLNPLGDLLSVVAGVVWALYSLCIRELGKRGYHPVKATRCTFGYGILFMLPLFCFSDMHGNLGRLIEPVNFCNLLFLGLVASAFCFVTWTVAVRILGVVRTSLYIYLVPVITVMVSIVVLDEPLTLLSALGIVLTLGGLFISQRKPA